MAVFLIVYILCLHKYNSINDVLIMHILKKSSAIHLDTVKINQCLSIYHIAGDISWIYGMTVARVEFIATITVSSLFCQILLLPHLFFFFEKHNMVPEVGWANFTWLGKYNWQLGSYKLLPTNYQSSLVVSTLCRNETWKDSIHQIQYHLNQTT